MRSGLWILLFVISFGIASAQESRTPVIVDTDMATDDWFALLYLLQHPDADVLAITVTGAGEATCPIGAENALDLLTLTGDIRVPVACGQNEPLEGEHVFPQEWRDDVDRMSRISLPDNPIAADERGAVALLIETLNAASSPVTVVTLGPLTNVAQALTAAPEIGPNIARIVIMGGAVDVPGNVQPAISDNAYAEWNIYVDPLALDIVLKSGVPITLVGLDATNQVPVTTAFYRALGRDRATTAANFVFEALEKNFTMIQSEQRSFWDPLTAAAAIDSSLITTETMSIRVVTEEGPESGRTVVDASGQTVEVAVGADAARFEQAFLNVLNNRAPEAEIAALAPADPAENKALVQRYYDEIWNTGELSALEELVDESFLSYTNEYAYAGGRDELWATLGLIRIAMPDLRVEILQLIAEGDFVAARVVISGTHTGDFMSIPPTGNPIRFALTSVLTVSGGKIVEERQTLDFLSLLGGFGIIPPDALDAIYGDGE
jgi:inosine-uridine nucleoside N-ribohydrolase/predicted ester cyclase